MNFPGDWRNRRNLLNQGVPFGPMHYTISNYSTDSKINEISDMKCKINEIPDDIFTTIQAIPDPLKKNLADSVITTADKKKVKPKTMSSNSEQKTYYQESAGIQNMENTSDNIRHDIYNSFTGITSFFSNVFGAISGAVFFKRPKSPAPQYYDCFQCDTHMAQQMAPDIWQMSSTDEQNKKIAPEQASNASNDNMSDCKTVVAQCEDKLNAVRSLLKNKPAPIAPKVRQRRPKRAFVQPNAVTNNEENFSPDQYVSLPNEEIIEYISVQSNQNHILTQIDGPKMKTEVPLITESAEIVKILPEITSETVNNVKESVIKNPETAKAEIISSCEDKMAKLKSLLQNKSTKPKVNIISPDSSLEPVKEERLKKTKVIPIDKPHDKRFKNPNRLVDKRMKSRMRKNIQEDTIFANEIDSEEISSVENSPRPNHNLQRITESEPSDTEENDYFDEMKGRFHSASTTDSDDSFQIVFSDSPKLTRMRRPSDCDSEDSFIVFEDTDKCYTSNDVFGDHTTTDESDVESSDSDSDASDSGCGSELKITHIFSRTVSDLTDESLYEETKSTETPEPKPADVVDCAVRTFDEIEERDIESVCEKEVEVENKGLLLDEAKKLRRKGQPPKKVSFSSQPPKVHVMRVWTFAARQARAGHWERHALDRERFKRRIADVDMAVSWVLKPQHRRRVMFQRFMPWWNQQKRIEAAEKKKREEERKKREEEERIAEELKRIEEENGKESNEETITSIEEVAEELKKIEEDNDANESGKGDREEGKQDTVSTVEEVTEDDKEIKTKLINNTAKGNYLKLNKGKSEINTKKNEKVNTNNTKNKEIVAINNKLTDLSIGLIVNENVATK